jgi:hypothetical protein
MKTLQDVATTFASLAYRNVSTKGLQTYAVDTGNLKDTVRSFNTPAKMITQRKSKSPTKLGVDAGTVAYQFAPPGAKYGKWVEWGNGTNVGKGKPRPFAGDAANDPELQKVIQEYQLSLTAQVGANAANQISKAAANMTSKVNKTK